MTSSFMQKNLFNDETVLCEGEIHFLAYGLPFFLAFVSLAFFALFHFYFPVPENKIFIVISLVCFLYGLLKKSNLETVMTDKRVILKTGIISRSVIEISLKKIEAFSINQTIAERAANAGTIALHGIGGSLLVLPPLKNYAAFSQTFTQWQENYS